jgi:predicted TIM-barrel enzyme
VGIPTIIGSGITADNIAHFSDADAFFIGSSVKTDGVWSGPLDAARVRAIVDALERASIT